MLHLDSFTWHAQLLVPHWHLRFCAGGVTLRGQYQVSTKHIVNASRSCVIHAEHGTMLMLSGPLHFLGDVRLTGSLQVVAQEDMASDSCFVVKGSLMLEMDLLRMSGCRSSGDGGALRTLGDLTVIGGKLEFHDCHAFQGGAIFVEGKTQIRGGEAAFTKCTASKSVRGSATKKATHKFVCAPGGSHQKQSCGGGLTVDGSLLLQKARMTFEHCSAEEFGGALCVIGGFDQQGGSMNLNTCTSGRDAGGVYVNGRFYEERGAMYFKNCTSSGQGGGMLLRCTLAGSNSCRINQSRLAFHSCSSAFGGGLSLSGALDLMHSNASFENCRAESEGGGLRVKSGSALAAQVASLEFKQCSAGRFGGGIRVEGKMSLDKSNVTFVECTAGRVGGGFAARDGRLTHSRGTMSFDFCKASAGSAFSSTWGAELAEVNIHMCTGLGAEVTSSNGNVSIQRLTFVYTGPSAGYEPALLAPNVSISEVNCTATHECTVYATTLHIPSLLCPPGREIEDHNVGPDERRYGCRLCEPGYFQPLPWRNPHCLPCPSEAQACDAVSVTMQAGYMLDVPNLSSIIDLSELESVKRTYFCPNAASCPGGRLAYQNQTAMCSPGATGQGCEFSTPGYAPGDYDNPCSKFKCPTAPSVWVMAASYLFGKDLFVFMLASSSVLGAKAGRKESAVLVNQLMAFGIIASRCLAALMQAEVFAGQAVFFRDVLHAWGMVVDAGTGQADSATTVWCFVKAMYDDSGLTGFFVFFALANVPALLLVCVFGCAKGFWLSIIVGSNCFLPAFCGRLSALLISFRPTQAADVPRFYYNAIDNSRQCVMVLATVMVLTICFSATIWLFLRATHSDQDPRSLQVLYLAAPYKPTYASWEVERLLRKMTFSVICTAFPVTMHPMIQIALLACISIVSAALYLKLQPYSLAKFNEMETGLLLAANVMAVLTLLSCHRSPGWGTDLPDVKFAAGVAAVSIGTGCTVWMAILIGTAFISEREKD
ncbi:unnamed protein product [Symbiodinium necroappetens]|uniref:Uncharacterized protein n=1 Tax=Symbiodinium necroappetens TaxID=1628268 RepID=A0A812JTQ5_9DINO|nr:unnamed protein product [Symbiodinium necroappetens]